jgi:fructokinase
MLGGIELGGTKVVCVAGSGPREIVAEERIDTGAPQHTLERTIAFFRALPGLLEAVGIASFGPVELRPGHPRFGSITRTPKPGWSGTDIAGPIGAALSCPVGFDTDVNGAALAEGRFGAATGLSTFVYLTVGTGIGGGAIVNGLPLHGLGHPEIGHVSVAREPGDDFAGSCPFHGACLEGLASGEAVRQRFGVPGEELEGAQLERAVELVAGYLASGLASVTYALAPERIVIGGGLSRLPGLLDGVREELGARLGGYPGLSEHSPRSFVAAAALGDRAGPAGALLLAERAAGRIRT